MHVPTLGWYWESFENSGLAQWNIDNSQECSDSEGWTYSVDFSSFTDVDSESAVEGMIHFVRRKRLYCSKNFDYNTIYMHIDGYAINIIYAFYFSYGVQQLRPARS